MMKSLREGTKSINWFTFQSPVSGNGKKLVIGLLFSFFFSGSLLAQYDYGDGSEGVYTAPVGASTLSGTHNYTSFTIPAGSTVTVNGNVPLIIKCKGDAVINGTLTSAGLAGAAGSAYVSAQALAPGGLGGGGGGVGWGGAGGNGGYGQAGYNKGSDGNKGNNFSSFNGGGSGGKKYGGANTISAGTGGSYGTVGETAPVTSAPSPGNIIVGSIYGDNALATTITYGPVTTNLLGGSGGGGGGARNQSVNNGNIYGGCGGGGGGGAIQITAYNITMGAGSLVSVRGGDGGSDAAHGVGAGGGGSGGTILFQYAYLLSGAALNTAPDFVSGKTIDIAGGNGGLAAFISGTYYYTEGGNGGEGRYLTQLDPNPPGLGCTAPGLTAKANGGITPATVCSGTTALSANPLGGSGCTGQNQYAWGNGINYWNGSAFAAVYPVFNAAYENISPSLSASGTYTIISRCSADTTCTNTQTIAINVGGSVVPAISISTPQKTAICQGTLVTFTATAVNGGSTPVYQWKKNGKNVGSNSALYADSTFANNDTIYCQLTSNAGCASTNTAVSDIFVLAVNPLATPSVTVTAPQTSICTGQQVTFTATGNYGGVPTYQWRKNRQMVGNGLTTYTDNSLVNGDTIVCIMTSDIACVTVPMVTSPPVVMSVGVTPFAGVISADKDSVCTGANGQLTVAGATGTVQWQWSDTTIGFISINGAITATYSPAVSYTGYYRVVVATGTCYDTSATYRLVALASPSVSFTNNVSGGVVAFNSGASTGVNSYHWDFGDDSTSQLANPVHTFHGPVGSHNVCLTGMGENGCSVTACNSVTIGTPTAAADLSLVNSFRIFPNPFSSYIFIAHAETAPTATIQTIRITNLLGQEVYSENMTENTAASTWRMNTSPLAAGMYYLRITTSEGDMVRPLIKQ